MKQIIGIVVSVMLISWYVGVPKSVEVTERVKTILTYEQHQKLVAEGIVSEHYNPERTYFSLKEQVILKKRSLIPFKINKEVILDKPVSYWSEDK